MTFEDEVAGVSGAVLGYIHNNVQGAYTGYQVGKKLSQLKANMGVAGKRQNPFETPPSTVRGRRDSVASTVSMGRASSRARSRSSVRSGVKRSVRFTVAKKGGNWRSLKSDAAFVAKKQKGFKQVRHKRAKVSPAFRRKVNDALHGTFYGEYEKGIPARMPSITANDSQQVFQDGLLFQPLDFFDAADVMFDGKAPADVPVLSTSKWTNGYIRKDYVVDSYATFEMKNFSQRTYTISMFNCAPKTKPQADLTVSMNPVLSWDLGLLEAYNQGTNPTNNLKTQLFKDPRHDPTFNKYWKAEVSTIVLGPGQSHMFHVPGPKGIEIDYSKQFVIPATGIPSAIMPYDKWTRGVFFVYYLDLVETALLGVGRYVSGGVGPGGLGYEKRLTMKMRVPDDAGFKYPATHVAGASQQLNYRLPARIKTYFPNGIGGAISDVLEENPISVIDPVD